MCGKSTVIHWFRKGLRVHDNPALFRAVEEAIKRKVKSLLKVVMKFLTN